MDWVDVGCGVATSRPVAWALTALGALGHGLVGPGLGALGLVLGRLLGARRLERIGLAALVAGAGAGLLSAALKPLVGLPRPDVAATPLAFPSGHATTAFALAAVLGEAFPAWHPLLVLAAVLASVARVYHRVHFLLDVAAGGVLGTVVGTLVARRLLGPVPSTPRWGTWALRLGVVAAALPPLLFFAAYERAVGAHQRPRPDPAVAAAVVVPFGTEAGRRHLGPGWSGDERWEDGRPMVWAEGPEATVALPALAPGGHRLQLRVYPFVGPAGPACQAMTVIVNQATVATIRLDRGWRWYEAPVPAAALHPGGNTLRLRFGRATRPRDVDLGADPRPLSAALSELRLVPGGP
jgi:membrane-associated phospholipid phosphatase